SESVYQPENGCDRKLLMHNVPGNYYGSAAAPLRPIHSRAGRRKEALYRDQEIQQANPAKPQPAWMKRGPQHGQESRSTFAGLEREYCSLSVVLFSRLASCPKAAYLGFLPQHRAVSVDLDHWAVS